MPQSFQFPKFADEVLPNTVQTQAGVEHLEPEVVHNLLKSGSCVLVDVRGKDRACGLIEGAVHVQAIEQGVATFTQKVPELVQRFAGASLVVFTCQYSAHRGPQCANWYREKAAPHQRVAVLTGGFRGWESKGLPVAAASPGAGQEADSFAVQTGMAFAQNLMAQPRSS